MTTAQLTNAPPEPSRPTSNLDEVDPVSMPEPSEALVGDGTGVLRTIHPFAYVPEGANRRTAREAISHHWECAVQRIGTETFVATMRSLKDRSLPEMEAEIPIEDVMPDDMELLSEGAVFYWVIGYETSAAGTRRRFSQIKFRRLAWTKKDLARVRAKAQEMLLIFGEADDAPKQATA